MRPGELGPVGSVAYLCRIWCFPNSRLAFFVVYISVSNAYYILIYNMEYTYSPLEHAPI